jgi:hypothetical protein
MKEKLCWFFSSWDNLPPRWNIVNNRDIPISYPFTQLYDSFSNIILIYLPNSTFFTKTPEICYTSHILSSKRVCYLTINASAHRLVVRVVYKSFVWWNYKRKFEKDFKFFFFFFFSRKRTKRDSLLEKNNICAKRNTLVKT